MLTASMKRGEKRHSGLYTLTLYLSQKNISDMSDRSHSDVLPFGKVI